MTLTYAPREQVSVFVLTSHPCEREAMEDALGEDPSIRVLGCAASEPAGIALVHGLRPDIVILDLPVSEGHALLKRLKHVLPESQAIVWTDADQVEELLELATTGEAAGYLLKNVRQDELRRAVLTIRDGGSVVTPALAAHLLRHFAASRPRSRRVSLSPREEASLRLLADGLTDRAIAAELGISVRTIHNHLSNVRAKTGLRRRAELSRWASKHLDQALVSG